MPPKKKKTQIKKVERGFATTSIPKKTPVAQVVEEQIIETTGPEPASVKEPENASEKALELDSRNIVLQALVDKLQDKVEKEITRTLKTIDYDRRLSKTWPALELEKDLRDEVIELAVSAESSDLNFSGEAPSYNREKLTTQIGITYGVLRRLGFQEDEVLQCLKTIRNADLEAALDWLYLHCPTEDLEFGKPSDNTPSTPKTSKPPNTTSNPVTPKKMDSKSLAPDTASQIFQGLESNPFILGNSLESNGLPQEKRHSILDSLKDEDPNVEYVNLKMRISDLTGERRQAGEALDDMFLQLLRLRLEEVKKSYFFDENDAEDAFRDKRRQADEDALLSHLRGESLPAKPSTQRKPKKKAPPFEPQKTVPSNDLFDIDGSDSDSPGGLLDILEPMPTTEVTTSGTTILVRDMALPKSWAGRTPKIMLADIVLKQDRYAAVIYDEISGGSRVKRCSVIVRWTDRAPMELRMDDVGCHDVVQAEQYIATLAIHFLTYPFSVGFQSSAGDSKGTHPSFRLLPPAYRDLWNELEKARKEREDEMNRAIWGTLTEIVEGKIGSAKKVQPKAFRPSDNQDEQQVKGSNVSDHSSEQLMASFYARQKSPSYQHMLTQRNSLPIASYRQHIVDMLGMSQVVVLSGETGCGKSTQLPSFILEDSLSRGEHCKIVVTEPRRISAISLAQRVSAELGDPPGAVGTNTSLVGYSIRLESHTSKNTRLTFVTNGIALRMLEGGTGSGGKGSAFDEITHIIVDEVHERSIESDFLLIVLKSLIEQRKNLKVVLMSATLDAEKISKYFGGCPTIQVPGRTYPVDVRFIEDAIECTKWSIKEGSPYARRVNNKFNRNAKRLDWTEDVVRDDEDDQEAVPGSAVFQGQKYSSNTISTMSLLDERLIAYELIIRLLDLVCFEDPTLLHMSSAFLVFMPGLGEIRRLNDLLLEHHRYGSDGFVIYPLHSTISSENQGAVFEVPPPGVRKIVIATNIAETGITIPDITCVIDSGKHREMRFDEKRQISRLIESFIARSNAAQRRGRAGRVQSGLCFHLFSKARHELMAEHPLPEMMRLSLSDLALRIKIMKVNLGTSIEDVLARALDPPSSVNIQRAISALVEVQALTSAEDITPMGRLLSKLPTDVHIGKFLLIAALFRCLDPALTIAAALNSKSPFVTPFGLEHEADRAKNAFKSGDSDFLTIHNVFSSWRRACANPGFIRKFCRQNFLSHQNLQQIEELRQQFLGYLVDSSFIQVGGDFVRELNRGRYSRNKTHFVNVPAEYDANNADNMALLNAALCGGLYPKLLTVDLSSGSQQMRTLGNNQVVSFHPSSVNFGRKPGDFGTNYLTYFTIMHSKRLYAWETGPADDLAVILMCGTDCEFKVVSDTVVIDRKIRYRIPPKTSIALKFLRTRLLSNLATQFEKGMLTEQQYRWNDLAFRVLGKVKPLREKLNNVQTVIIH